MLRFLFSLLLLVLLDSPSSAGELFAVAVSETPVLNRPDFNAVFGGKDGRSLLTDGCGQLRAVEFVALPGTVFTIEEKIAAKSGMVYRVTSADYPYPSANGLFVDARSVRLEPQRPAERARSLPAREQILANMEQRVGTRYVWGGNVAAGAAALTDWYPPSGTVDRGLWQLAGLDCSGLLYEATNGFTPRNTSALVTYGAAVKIAGKSAREIAAELLPLDLIVWPGHVLIVLDGGRLIESRLDCRHPREGVRIRPLAAALADIMQKRTPADGITKGAREFVVRRWYEGTGR
jgi:cell wall-associated NlpC family hydrolase